MEREERSRHEELTSTKEKILNVAEELFAERGFQGTRTRDIAERAGINISTLHFHWKCKEELYAAVYQRLLTQRAKLSEDIFACLETTPAWEEAMHGVVNIMFAFFRAHKHAARLDSYWNLEPHALSAELEQNQAGPLLLSVAERMRRWLPKELARQTDVELAILTSYNFLQEYFVNPAALGRLLGEKAPRALENRVKRHAQHLMKRLYHLA
ncbi:MAG: TetR/AcrR family transcriptional regulator [Candidatus Binatia bacterium]